MGGGLMQLTTMGSNVEYIIGNPEITYFKSIYRRHTNFAIESVQQNINGDTYTDNVKTQGDVTISKSGDLVSNVYVVCEQNEYGVNGSEVVSNVELIIGGTLIDRQSNEWMKIWSELTTPLTKVDGYRYMTGGFDTKFPSTNQSSIIIPLYFWFCRYIGSSIPLISLQYHDLKLNFVWGINSDINRDNNVDRSTYCEVWCDYIYLDSDERVRISQNKHEYLIEQVQSIDTSIIGESISYRMNAIKHPVKEIIWVEGNTGSDSITKEKIKLTFNGVERFPEQYKEYFTLHNPYKYHTNIPGFNIKEYSKHSLVSDSSSGGTYFVRNSSVAVTDQSGSTILSPGETHFCYVGFRLSTINNNNLVEVSDKHMVLYGIDKLIEPQIGDRYLIRYDSNIDKDAIDINSLKQGGGITKILNVVSINNVEVVNGESIDILQEIEFDKNLLENTNITDNEVNGVNKDTISFEIVSRITTPKSVCSNYSKNIYVYSFCLNPEEHQPSGTCNFSRINDSKLVLTDAKKIDHIYAVNYNILRISNGLGAIVYTV